MPNIQRSSIFNMLKERAPEDRQICDFPGPYKLECTPYRKLDFSKVTYKKCLEENKTPGASWFKLCKVIIIGDVSVGKTCLVNRFCRKVFDTNYKSTIGVDFEVERFDILNVAYNLQIWDTAGQERFKSIARSYYRGAHVIVIAFDFNNMESLFHCKTWLQEALFSSSSICPFIFLVGTKMDLLKKYAFKNMEINAMKVAKHLNAEFWAVSSKTGRNLNQLFHRIAALTFDDSIRKGLELKDKVEIGTNLISFKEKEAKNSKRSCEGGLQCIK